MGIHLITYIEPPGRSGHVHNLNHCVYLANKKPRIISATAADTSLLSIITSHVSNITRDLDVDIHMDHTDTDTNDDNDDGSDQEEEEEEEDNTNNNNDDDDDEPYRRRSLLRRPRNIPLRRSVVSSLVRKPSVTAVPSTYKRFVTYGCRHCRNHLSSSLQIISKDYRGKTGDAYLISSVCNVLEDKVETRSMLTGEYLVCDIVCNLCKRVLGWKYLKSERKEQRYKEGKYILEVKTICRCN